MAQLAECIFALDVPSGRLSPHCTGVYSCFPESYAFATPLEMFHLTDPMALTSQGEANTTQNNFGRIWGLLQ